MKKTGRIVLALLVSSLFVCSLVFAAGGGEGAKSEGKRKLIAYTGFAPTLPFFIELGKGVEDKCKELGFDFTNVSPAETKPELQVQGLENAIIKGVDGIVMSPIDARALKNPFDMALKKKIPIIVVDAPVDHPAAIAFFGTDNLAAAQGAGRYIVEKTKAKGDLLLLGGQIGHPNGDKRLKGVKETCEAAGMKVIVRPTDWDTAKAMQFAHGRAAGKQEYIGDLFLLGPGSARREASREDPRPSRQADHRGLRRRPVGTTAPSRQGRSRRPHASSPTSWVRWGPK